METAARVRSGDLARRQDPRVDPDWGSWQSDARRRLAVLERRLAPRGSPLRPSSGEHAADASGSHDRCARSPLQPSPSSPKDDHVERVTELRKMLLDNLHISSRPASAVATLAQPTLKRRLQMPPSCLSRPSSHDDVDVSDKPLCDWQPQEECDDMPPSPDAPPRS